MSQLKDKQSFSDSPYTSVCLVMLGQTTKMFVFFTAKVDPKEWGRVAKAA